MSEDTEMRNEFEKSALDQVKALEIDRDTWRSLAEEMALQLEEDFDSIGLIRDASAEQRQIRRIQKVLQALDAAKRGTK